MDESNGPFGYRKPEGEWGRIFSAHSFQPIIDRAEGIYLYDTEGRRYIDVSGGPMAVNIGHGDRRIRDAIVRQFDKYAYCHPVLSDQTKADLCERLSRVAPGDLNTTYLTPGGGSDAIETALKIARQYHISQGKAGKSIFVSWYDSYHGMSLGALSVAGIPGIKKPFNPMSFQWPKVHQYSERERPAHSTPEEHALRAAQELEEIIHYYGADNVAGFIATPIGAGADYGLVAPAIYWKTIREICDRHAVLLIADEVVTGFGRTGKWFAMEHFGVQADMMTIGKGLSSVNAPIGAVMVSDRVNKPFSEGLSFLHGFTNAGHPLSCAVSMAVLDIIEQDGLIENSAAAGEYLHSKKERLLAHPSVADVRGRGLILVMELVANKNTMEFFPRGAQAEFWLQSIGLQNGAVFYGALYGPRQPSMPKRGLNFWIAPPLSITRDQIDELLDAVERTLSGWEDKMGIA